MSSHGIAHRRARAEDLEALRALHRRSLEVLGAPHYTPAEIAGLFATAETADPAVVDDGTFFVAERAGAIVASGAWTQRVPGYAARLGGGPAALPESATIRGVFVAPEWQGRGVARDLMRLVEEDAVLRAGALRLDLLTTLAGVAFYRGGGYLAETVADLPLVGGGRFRGIRMSKEILPLARAA